MSKVLKVMLIIFIFLFFCINTVFATNTIKNNTNTTANTTVTNTASNTTTQTTNVTSVDRDSIDNGTLGFNNVLNILLITVGVVIIFLAIAILIRLK